MLFSGSTFIVVNGALQGINIGYQYIVNYILRHSMLRLEIFI